VDEVFTWEVLNYLELLVPVVHLLRINSVERNQSQAKLISGAYLLLWLGLFNPVVQRLDCLADKERLSVKNAIKVNFKILAKEG
jgi:hypothetical protein